MAENINNIPDGWESKKLSEVSRIIMGQSPDSLSYNEEGIGYPFLQGCAEFGSKYPNPVIACSAPTKISPEDSILISVRAPVGDINLSNTTYCIGRGLASIVPESVDKYFLFDYIKLNRDKLERVSQGSTFSAIGSKELINFNVLTPPLPEQKAIAKVLTTIDNVIEKTEELIDKLKSIKKGLMQDLFTRGVLPDGSLRPLRENAPELYKESELGWIPKEWEVVSCYDLVDIINGGTPETSRTEYWEGNIGWLSVEDFNTGERYVYSSNKTITQLGLNNSSTNILKAGMIIISARGTVGVIAQIGHDMAFNQSCYGLNSLDETLRNDYIYYFLLNYVGSLKHMSHGGVFDTITRETFKSILVKLPNQSEQLCVCQILSQIDNRIVKEQQYLRQSLKTKKGLMDDLLTGKVRVTELESAPAPL